MATNTRSIGSWTVVVETTDALEPAAHWLLGTLQRLHDQGTRLGPGVRIQLGGLLLVLEPRGAELHVRDPIFPAKPGRATQDDISGSLTVLLQQRDILARVGVEGVPVRFDEKITLARECLAQPRLYLERSQPLPGDSGWYVGPVEGAGPQEDVENLEALQVADLLRLRPALLAVLALPPGFLVVMVGDRVEAVLNPKDEELWKAKAPDAIAP